MAGAGGLVTVGTDVLQRLVTRFPPTAYSFAYGSAVFAQKNQQVGKMVDLIFVVDNAVKWHTQNLALHPRHYSFLKYFGPKTIVDIQERMACGVYYNTLVHVDDQLLKYGVISTHALVDDLKNWTHAYISGRLQKPVKDLHLPSNSQLVKYIKQNRLSALRAVLLQLPTHSTKLELYHGITELSYFGDSRMALGENPNKVGNIVAANVNSFDEIYQPLIRELHPLVEGTSPDLIIQDTSSEARLKHLLLLPSFLQRTICRISGRNPALDDVEDVLVEISSLPALGPLVRQALGEIVWKSSLRQTMQGILTAGPTKAIKYGVDKIRKKISGSSEPPSARVIRPTLSADESYKLQVLKERRRLEEEQKVKVAETKSGGKGTAASPTNQATPDHADQPPNLSDLEFPFGLRRPIQESHQPTHRKGFITFTVGGQEEGILEQRESKKVISPIPPILSHELNEPIPKGSNDTTKKKEVDKGKKEVTPPAQIPQKSPKGS